MRAIGPQFRVGFLPVVCQVCGRDFLAKSSQCRTCQEEPCQRELKRRQAKAREERKRARRAA